MNGFDLYNPITKSERVHRGRKSNVLLPLFPGYLFVSIVQRWYEARWCPGVVRLVMDGEQPAHVPDRVIDSLRKRERNGVIPIPKNGFALGEQVRVISGPFCGPARDLQRAVGA